ncbi:pyruvate carboxylase [Burkholderia lata]|nr:pyruvate carboxylase [Burkholderia lata]
MSLFKGELGFPPDGFPAALSRKVLKSEPSAPYRPGDQIPPVDLDAVRAQAEAACAQPLDDRQRASNRPASIANSIIDVRVIFIEEITATGQSHVLHNRMRM